MLYLIHGGGGNYRNWPLQTTIENLAKSENTVIVMPTVHDRQATMEYTGATQFVGEELPRFFESFGEALDVYTHPMDPDYAEDPHLHSVMLSPLAELYAVCDMGTDKLYLFKIENDRLVPAGNTPLQLERGCCLAPEGGFLAVANKVSSTVEFLRVADDGTLSRI